MHNIVISFSINYTTTKIVFVNTMPDEMLFKNSKFTLLLPKNWLLKQIIKNVRRITKSDAAIQIEPTTYCNISPRYQPF